MATEKRTAISKRVRFDVFKRDSFKCQYCGKSAPDVVLEVDHIKPVAAGGDNNITNLITSCFECNRGKSDKQLSENATVTKQKAQLDELNEKRNQLEMLAEWRDELRNLDDTKIEILNRVWVSGTGRELLNEQKLSLKSLLKRYDLPLLIDSLEASITQYLKFDKSEKVIEQSVEKAFDYTERIAKNKKNMDKNPHLKDLYYARGILRNRLFGRYADDKKVIIYLNNAYKKGASTADLIDLCKVCSTWTSFKTSIDRFVNEGVSLSQSIEELSTRE
jgi:hypothetical protein